MLNKQEVLKLNIVPEGKEPWLNYEDYLKGAIVPLSHPLSPSIKGNYVGGRGLG
jgi:hypothetical protein